MLTLRTKIMTMIMVVFALLLLSTLTYHYARKQEENRFKQIYRENTIISIQTLLSINERELLKTTMDYAQWDDMVNFVKTGDPAWAKENIASMLITMDMDYACVLNEKFVSVYSVSDSSDFKKSHFPISSVAIKEAIKGKSHCYFFTLSPDGIVEISVSSIVPSYDLEHTSAAKGYLVNGRLWNPDYLKLLGKTTNAEIEIIPLNALEIQKANLDPKEKKYIVIHINLPDYQGKNIIRLDFISKTQLQLDENFFLYFTIIPILISLIFGIVFIFAFRSWITKPLALISDSLDHSSPGSLSKISPRDREFHSIAMMMISFFESKSKLEQAIEEKKITEKRIQEYSEELKESNQSKDKFFSILAHDLRSPFHSILGYSEILNNEYDSLGDDERKKFISILRASTKNVYDLLENLLQWSRLQTGRMTCTPETFDISFELEDTLDVLKVNALRKNIEVANSIPEGTMVVADKNMVRSVLQNLISNAVKFTNIYGIISVSAIRKEKFLEVVVRDTGIGISKEDMEKLFRIDISFTRKGTAKESGTGLGLILSRELIHKNGGTIWVESEVGKGTTFHFTIPSA